MGKRTKLLATVALPIVSLVWQPAAAAPLMPVRMPDAVSQVITVQAEGGSGEEEQLLQKRKKQREEKRKEARDSEGGERKKTGDKQRDAAQGRERQDDRQKTGDKQRDAVQGKERQDNRQKTGDKQRDAAQGKERQDDRQKVREEKRQRERDAAEKAQQEEQRKAQDAKRKKERDAAEKAKQEEQQKAQDAKRKKERDAAEKARQEEQQKAQDAKRRKERDAAEKARQEEQQKAQDARRKKEREAAGTDRTRGEEDAGNRPRRKRDADRERIARDPTKTSETIELPFDGGTAVLDSDKDADNRRDVSRDETRRKRAEERAKVKVRVPRSDADAQVDRDGNKRKPVRYESAERERGERRDRRPDYDNRSGWRVERRVDDRAVINFNDRIIVRSDDSRRLSREAQETYYEQLPNGRVREVIVRPNGDRVVTIRDRYGEMIQRSRIDRSGREYVMFYAPEFDRDSRPTFVDPGSRLPPMRLAVPLDDYIADTSSEAPRDYREFLERPPVEEVERVYTLDEVRYSARIRDKVRRIDLDTITFATGSADVSMNQAATLRKVAEAIDEILDADPGETFLIEGHTDAVGSDESNLILSDRRAETVADILTDVYDIPPENLATQGYGERFLKIATEGPEQLNRRVTIRRVTPLVKPVAMAQ